MFKLILPAHEKKIHNLVNKIETSDVANIVNGLSTIIDMIRNDIPEKKRISYGRYNIIKQMGLFMYPLLEKRSSNILKLTDLILGNPDFDPFIRSLTIQLVSIYGQESGDLDNVLPLFEKAASDKQWELRECAAGFIRKLIRMYPDRMYKWYLMMVQSEDPMQRRFASESLRPIADNNWFKNNPEFVFPILEHLYKEPKEYPRTSAGNSLSDWMRIDEEKTIGIVKKLVASDDKNSRWIAFRACRNLVKKEPLLVMDMLKIDEYKYKDREYYRKDYQ